MQRGETGNKPTHTTTDPRIPFDPTQVCSPLLGGTSEQIEHNELYKPTTMNDLPNIEPYSPDEIDEIVQQRLIKFLGITAEPVDFVNTAGIKTRELHITADTADIDVKIIIPDDPGFLNALSAYLHILYEQRYLNNAGT